jgi:phosphatidylglycerophosphate synthase
MAEKTTNYEVTERRPMKPREWPVMTGVARVLNRAGVSPNSISIASIVACCIAGSAFAATSSYEGTGQRVLWLVGAACVQLRAICNLLDGMVAVESGKASAVGELYNEVPDRLSDAVMLIGLGYAVGSSPLLGYAAALVAVFVAYIRAQGRVAGAPQDYRGPMGKPHRMFLVTFVGLFLACAPATWQGFWWGPEYAWGIIHLAMWVIIIGGLLTAARRLFAAGQALRGT